MSKAKTLPLHWFLPLWMRAKSNKRQSSRSSWLIITCLSGSRPSWSGAMKWLRRVLLTRIATTWSNASAMEKASTLSEYWLPQCFDSLAKDILDSKDILNVSLTHWSRIGPTLHDLPLDSIVYRCPFSTIKKIVVDSMCTGVLFQQTEKYHMFVGCQSQSWSSLF